MFTVSSSVSTSASAAIEKGDGARSCASGSELSIFSSSKSFPKALVAASVASSTCSTALVSIAKGDWIGIAAPTSASSSESEIWLNGDGTKSCPAGSASSATCPSKSGSNLLVSASATSSSSIANKGLNGALEITSFSNLGGKTASVSFDIGSTSCDVGSTPCDVGPASGTLTSSACSSGSSGSSGSSTSLLIPSSWDINSKSKGGASSLSVGASSSTLENGDSTMTSNSWGVAASLEASSSRTTGTSCKSGTSGVSCSSAPADSATSPTSTSFWRASISFQAEAAERTMPRG